MAKSHQLPYQKSLSRSSFPLELVFSDVLGPACDSFRENKYNVSIMADYNKFVSVFKANLPRGYLEVGDYLLGDRRT